MIDLNQILYQFMGIKTESIFHVCLNKQHDHINETFSQWHSGSQWISSPAPTCSGPVEMVHLELSKPDSTFFRGCGAWELTLSKDVHLV